MQNNLGNSKHSSDNHTIQELFENFLQENMGIVHRLLRPYRGLDEYEDLMQEAYIGIFKALTTYDPRKGSRLTSYAYTCAQNEVRMYLRKSMAKRRACTTVSLETWDGNEENQNKLLEYILGSKNLAASIESMDYQICTNAAFQTAMEIVDNEMDRTSKISIHCFMAGNPQSETAKVLGMSQSAVSKEFDHALIYLQARMKDLGFDGL